MLMLLLIAGKIPNQSGQWLLYKHIQIENMMVFLEEVHRKAVTGEHDAEAEKVKKEKVYRDQ